VEGVLILAAHQPQYLPWLGYFDKMARADRFVLLDTVQYKKNEWQNRNRIRSASGWQWLTVPVHARFPARFDEVEADETAPWRRKHLATLRQAYARAPHRETVLPALERLLQRPLRRLAELNIEGIRLLADLFEVRTETILASSLAGIPDGPDARLIALCRRFGADQYLAGAGGRDYMDLDAWRRAGITVTFQDFHGPEYAQCHPGFEANLSAVDYLVHCGPGPILRHAAPLREAA